MRTNNLRIFFICMLAFVICLFNSSCTKTVVNNSLNYKDTTFVSPDVAEYANSVIKPLIANIPHKDTLLTLQKISEILISKKYGVNSNTVEPSTYIYYDILENIKLGFLVTLNLTPQQKQNIKHWHDIYMSKDAADVFFAPSASEIIKTKGAFGCTHYARAFIAVVKALNIIDNPNNLRYTATCVAEKYNEAYKKQDYGMTINGHQFVMARIQSKWYAINTSKGGIVEMSLEFSPDHISPPQNTAIQFPSYPEVTFLFRKIGKNYSDNIQDNSHNNLMNIYRSGESDQRSFLWNEYKQI